MTRFPYCTDFCKIKQAWSVGPWQSLGAIKSVLLRGFGALRRASPITALANSLAGEGPSMSGSVLNV
jgi:hypothetical protein